MFKTLSLRHVPDYDFPERVHILSLREKLLNGKIYDPLPYPFHQEKNGDQYIPLRDRRPSARYSLVSIVVEDSVSLLFSERGFPRVYCANELVRDALQRVIGQARLSAVMLEAARRGSVGSVAVLFRVLSNRCHFQVLRSLYLTPTWRRDAPDELERVVEQYKTTGAELVQAGYVISEVDLSCRFWFRREWNVQFERVFLPKPVDSALPWVVDESRTVQHGLGFVPVVWIKNLPGGDGPDGLCTWPDEVADVQIEIDYQLSQVGRGLKYSSDPTLLVKEPVAFGEQVRGSANALLVEKDGDAKLLEISGDAANAVISYVRLLREFALESAHGNRFNVDRFQAAQSGRAMELMNESLVRLSGRLRVNYGLALLDLCRMVVVASQRFNLVTDLGRVGRLASERLTLQWSPWYQPTYFDLQTQATTLSMLVNGAMLSRQSAVDALSNFYGVADTSDELRKIQEDFKNAVLPRPNPYPNVTPSNLAPIPEIKPDPNT